MARKKPHYSAEQFRTIKFRLQDAARRHAIELQTKTAGLSIESNDAFHRVADIRDIAQKLTSTMLALENADMYIRVCEMSGEQKQLYFDPYEIDVDLSGI